MKGFIICINPQKSLGRQSHGGCGERGLWHAWKKKEKCIFFDGGEVLRERNHWEDRGVDGRMGSEWILGSLAGWGVDRIQLAEDRGRWWAVESAVMIIRVLTPRS
jgi:hypothetical protein